MPNELRSTWTYFFNRRGFFYIWNMLHQLKFFRSAIAKKRKKHTWTHVVLDSNGRWDFKVYDQLFRLGLGSNVQLGLVDFKVLRSANQDWFNWTTGF